MTKPVWALLLVFAFVLSGCGGSGGYRSEPQPGPVSGGQKIGKPYRIGGIWYYPKEDNNYDESGMASWYGPQFHGRPTANGERFDMNALTAAHRTLPLPSVVLVTNLENGRSIRVRVNDRGPFAKGRIIDLSRRSAQLLGFEKQGVARVRVQLVRPDGTIARGNGRTTVATGPARRVEQADVSGPLFVQIGSFSTFANANRLLPRLREFGNAHIQSMTLSGQTVYRLRLGPYDDRRQAERILEKVFDRGFYEARIFTDQLG